MRFMMLMIPDVYQPQNKANLDPNFAPPADAVEAMMAYNEKLAQAGVLIGLNGLTPLDKGARVSYTGGKATATDGPFVESKEVLGGYWIINVASKEEAVEWALKIPAGEGDVVEIRQIFEMSDFPENAQEIAANSIVQDVISKSEQ